MILKSRNALGFLNKRFIRLIELPDSYIVIKIGIRLIKKLYQKILNLLKMPVNSLTKNNLEKLKKNAEDINKQIKDFPK